MLWYTVLSSTSTCTSIQKYQKSNLSSYNRCMSKPGGFSCKDIHAYTMDIEKWDRNWPPRTSDVNIMIKESVNPLNHSLLLQRFEMCVCTSFIYIIIRISWVWLIIVLFCGSNGLMNLILLFMYTYFKFAFLIVYKHAFGILWKE